MKAVIEKSRIQGSIVVPPSKSIGHRLLILAAQTEGETRIENLPLNEDIGATCDCLQALGARIQWQDRTAVVKGQESLKRAEERVLPCRESGSTLRFLLPVAQISGGRTVFTGSKRLLQRPLGIYEDICLAQKIHWEKEEERLTLEGALYGGEFSFPGNVSSQFVTGLLLALPKVREDSRIVLQGEFESASYVDLTLEALRTFSYRIQVPEKGVFEIPGRQKGTSPGSCTVPGDQSGAAFFGALNALGGQAVLLGLEKESLQGDRVWKEIMERMAKGCPTVSLKDCPDLGPILMATAALLQGAHFRDTARLKIKESDRGAAMAEELSKCGVKVQVGENEIYVPGGQVKVPDRPFDSHNDHRIAMALAVLSTVTGGTIQNAQAVNKSMPEFFRLLTQLGGKLTLVEE